MPFSDAIMRGDASALIPEEVSREILGALPAQSAALTLFRRGQTMSRNQQRVPVLSMLPQAYFVNGDTGLKQTTKAAWQNKYLNAEEIACIVPIPENVLDDAEYDIWEEIKPLIEEAIGLTLDGAVIFGTNKPASWPNAVEDFASAAGNTFVRGSVAGQDVAGDINSLMALVEADGFAVNGFLGRVGMKADLRGLRDNNKGLLFQPSLAAGTPSTLYGETIRFLTNGVWDNGRADLIAGDFSQAIISLRQDITYKMLTEATIHDSAGNVIFNLAQQDMVALRVTFRAAYQVANPITRLQTVEKNRAPFAVLRPVGFVGP